MIVFIAFVSNAYSESDDINVHIACKKHSIEVIKNLKQNIFIDMTEEEIISALKISKDSCHKYFGNLQITANQEKQIDLKEEEEKKTTGSDWFSEYILHGNPHSKDGVKRLKKRH